MTKHVVDIYLKKQNSIFAYFCTHGEAYQSVGIISLHNELTVTWEITIVITLLEDLQWKKLETKKDTDE